MKNKFKYFIAVLVLSISIMFSGGGTYADIGNGITSNNLKTEFSTKAPFGKRQLAMKFLLAMLGVATSSVVIYVILSIYNKYMYGGRPIEINEDDNDFKTPTNMKEAINIFLKKTK